MLVLLKLLFVLTIVSLSAGQYQTLNRSSTQQPFRLKLQTISGAFGERQEELLGNEIYESVESFYFYALKTKRIIEPLIPSNSTCLTADIPDEHLASGVEADIIIYVSNDTNRMNPFYGKVCEQEKGDFKRPIIGFIGLSPLDFFSLFKELQIEIFIRECAHVLAFDFDLFPDFVKSDGTPYSRNQRVVSVLYPNRGLTVKALAFPKMLEKAREHFDCEIEGVEFEDFLISMNISSLFFWSSRVMTHDILSSFTSNNIVFSSISLAVFEDSGWYTVDYNYSNILKWGYKAGCGWFKEKCIKNQTAYLPGFCDLSTKEHQCDPYGIGYGNCGLFKSVNIPKHEQYFNNIELGGYALMSYCPFIHSSPADSCQEGFTPKRNIFGEVKGISSMCFKSSLIDESFKIPQRIAEGVCYRVEKCEEKFVTLNIANSILDCPYGSKVTVEGYKGYIYCPESQDYCQNVPCLSLCTGNGRCKNGVCICNPGWTGEKCSIKCLSGCKTCMKESRCIECLDGFMLYEGNCLKCNDACLTCAGSPSSCTSCPEGSELVGNSCDTKCLPHCSSCFDPCTKCDSHYFLSDGKCFECNEMCKECKEEDKCLNCNEGYILINGDCRVSCIDGCIDCSNPCKECKVGYFLSKGLCDMCQDPCASCEGSSTHCTKCFGDFIIVENTCKSPCPDHCISCDFPCTQCEDGFFAANSVCEICDSSCQTCLKFKNACTSCKEGYTLVLDTCKKTCDSNCEKCENLVCSKCKKGYFLERDICSKCHETCETCSLFATRCETCPDNYGLVNFSCEKDCMDHCLSCDTPCTNCEKGFYKHNGVCLKCDDSCSECTSNGNTAVCLICAEGYELSERNCKLKCQNNCRSCDEPCTLCENGYFNHELGCAKCSDTCKSCSKNHLNCTSCETGFGLINNTCIKGCDDHCLSCDVPCNNCEPGYILSDSKCVSCEYPCKECSISLNNCTSCFDEYRLESNICKPLCIKGCSTCDLPCSSCRVGYVLTDGMCKDCPAGCATCSSQSENCFSCIKGYSYSSKVCRKLCLPYCSSCDDPCTICQPGYLSIDGQCFKCTFPCTSCIETLSTCTTCHDLYFLNDSKCTPLCIEHCLNCDDPCTDCEVGYYLYSNKCIACSSLCRTCSGSYDYCLSCHGGYALENNNCIAKCDPNCIECSFPCKACVHGYSLKNGECIYCPRYFTSAQIKAEFIMDYTGISLEFSEPVLDIKNRCELYFRDSTLDMFGVLPLCSWTSSNILIVTFGQNPEYRVKMLELNTIIGFGSDCLESINLDIVIPILNDYVSKPFVSLSAPTHFSIGCENEALVVQGITEESSFKFSATTEPENKELESYINSTNEKTLVIPQYLLQELRLNIKFIAQNYLNESSSISKIITITKAKALSISLDSGSNLKLSTTQEIIIRGLVVNSCIDNQKILYQWSTLLSGDYSLINNNSSVLTIKKGSLQSGQSYIFRLTAVSDTLKDSAEVEIRVVDSPLVAILDRSDSTFNVDERFILSAERSYDPNNPNSVLHFNWECLEATEECRDSKNESLIFKESSPILNIAPHRMIVGRNYSFKVTVFSKNKIVNKLVLISAVQYEGSISIPSFVKTVNTQRDFSIYPEFHLPNKNYKFEWKQISGTVLISSSEEYQPFIVIPQNVMMDGRPYKFLITASCDKESISSYVEWTSNSAPICEDLKSKVIGNSVALLIDCYDGDHSDFPLQYVFGIKNDKEYFPLKVSHSSFYTFTINSGNYSFYVDICDSLNSCIQKHTQVEVKGRHLNESIEKDYHTEKKIPDNLPLAIYKNAEKFTKDNFLEVFNDVKEFIFTQKNDLFYLKMVIGCFEIITKSDKTHFIKVYQSEIVDFLTTLVEKLEYVDEQSINYIIDLFSQNEIIYFEKVSSLILLFSEKWARDLPPNGCKNINNKISLFRHRMVGNAFKQKYELSQKVELSDIAIKGDQNKLYDFIVLVFPSHGSPIVDIKFYEVGTFQSYNYKFLNEYLKLNPNLKKPFTITYLHEKPKDKTCVQLRGNAWVHEGCDVTQTSDSSISFSVWNLNSFKVVSALSIRRSYYIALLESILLSITIIGTVYFCLSDRSRLNYFQPMPGETDNQKLGPSENQNVDGESSPATPQVAQLTFSFILYHPAFNIISPQSGERRPASVLHISSVVFCELLCVSLLFNPGLGEIFGDDETFKGFSSLQLLFFGIGILICQLISFLLGLINRIESIDNIRRFIGMCISIFLITLSAGLGIILESHYPLIYSFYWLITFFGILIIEFAVFESIMLAVYYFFFQVHFETSITVSSRNVRVLTTES